MPLRPWQEKAVPHLIACLAKHGAAADLSDPGTGKTYTSCEIVRQLGKATLVVAPKVVLPAWHKVAGQMGTELDAINYEMARTGRTPYGEWKREGRQRRDRFHWHRGIEFLVFDEAHRCAGWQNRVTRDAEGNRISRAPLQSEMLMAARRQGIDALVLSATLADSPLELKAAGYVLGLHDGDESNDTLATFHTRVDPFYNWVRRHGCGKGAFTDLEFKGTPAERALNMAKIHSAIIPDRGVRVRISDLGDAFPETQITAELYEAGSPAKVDALYKEMAEALRELDEHAKEHHKNPEAPLTKLIRARQEVELTKVPIFVEMAQDAIAQGQSVAIFVNFSRTIEELRKRLKTNCVIDGSQIGERGARERQANMAAFQEDRERIIICNGDAGGLGISLHDLRGVFPRVSLISPGYSAKVLRQILGRIWREGGLSKSLQRILCLAGTVEEKVSKAITRKLNCLDALCDGDLMP